MKKIISPLCLILFSVLLAETATGSDGPGRAKKKSEYSILTYNVRNCRGLDDLTDYQRVAGIINRINPGIVALQELDSATLRSKGAVVLNELADRTKMYPVFGPSIPYQGGKYGVGLLLREKPLRWRSVALPGREERRSLLIAELKDVIICCSHFSLTEADRLESARIINDLFSGSEKPVFLAGDLNASPESGVIKIIEEKWTMLNDPASPTIPADNPSRCIDYIFILKSPGITVVQKESRVEQEPVASDHLPVWVRVTTRKKIQKND